MRVLKFGGAALRDGPAIWSAAHIVRERGGTRPLIVVSAHEGVTALLDRAFEAALHGDLAWDPLRIRHRSILRQLELPGDLLDRYLVELRGVLAMLCDERRTDRRIRDFVLSFGERMSARVFAAALRRQGIDATPMDAFDLGLVSSGGNLEDPAPRLVRAVCDAPGIPVVTGFLALDRDGCVTTLGRNGSDLTAAWLAAALEAEEIQLWKNVPGLLTADPKLVPRARRVQELGWRVAAELARHGAEVLHPGALEPAARARIPVRLLDIRDPNGPGSLLAGESRARGPVAIACRANLAGLDVRLDGGQARGARVAEILARLAAQALDPYLGRTRADGVEVLVADEPRLSRVIGTLGSDIAVRRELASVAIVGPGVADDANVETELRGVVAAFGESVALEPAEPGGQSRVLVTQKKKLGELVLRIHEALFENHPSVAVVGGQQAS